MVGDESTSTVCKVPEYKCDWDVIEIRCRETRRKFIWHKIKHCDWYDVDPRAQPVWYKNISAIWMRQSHEQNLSDSWDQTSWNDGFPNCGWCDCMLFLHNLAYLRRWLPLVRQKKVVSAASSSDSGVHSFSFSFIRTVLCLVSSVFSLCKISTNRHCKGSPLLLGLLQNFSQTLMFCLVPLQN